MSQRSSNRVRKHSECLKNTAKPGRPASLSIKILVNSLAQSTQSYVAHTIFPDTRCVKMLLAMFRKVMLLLGGKVSRLMILHEDAEDGNAMPDLERPVQAVSLAVSNLVKVGRETINSCDDSILKQDMPAALIRVEEASKLLEEASALLKADPYSAPARKKLIGGSRGILQGTSALLLCFDESEVRKLLRDCKKVLDYLAVAEVIDTMEDLVHFLKDLSPCLSKVSREVSAREKELTHQVHAEILVRCLEQVKTLVPILICSMKIYTHIVSQGGKGAEEAAENRNYLTNRMAEEIHEIMRVLQLTTYDEDQSELDNLTVLKKLSNTIHNKMFPANDWLGDPLALRGGVGEKSVRQILDNASKIADRCLPKDAEHIRKLVGDIQTMTDALCELRQDGKGSTPQAESLARSIKEKLADLQQACVNAVVQVDKAGVLQTAHTVQGRLEQARRWLIAPGNDDKGLGKRAIALIVEEGKKVAEGLPGVHKAEILGLCDEIEGLSHQLTDLCNRGLGNSPQAQQIAKNLSQKLHELKERIQNAVVNRVVEDFIDITTPLKQFTDAVLTPEGVPGRDQNFADKAATLQQFSNRAVKTAKIVAAGGSGGNKKIAEALLSSSNQVESLTPQLVSAGRIRMSYPENKAADEHFENLRQQYADTIMRVRNLCDEATDSADFIKISEEQMQKHTFLCEDAIRNKQPQKMVDNTSSIARLANRVLLVAKQESDNSEDLTFIDNVNRAANSLQNAVPIMVQDAKQVAINPSDANAVSRWRESNRMLLGAVGQVHNAVKINPELPPYPDINNLHLNEISSSPPPIYNYFVDKVGEPLRNVPSPGEQFDNSTSPIPQHLTRTVSPLPKWARGDNADLLYQELSTNNHDDSNSPNVTFQQEPAPPRPPLPQGETVPIRPPPPETDDEDEIFKKIPHPSQPIMVAAHGLHQEVRQWSSKDNEIIAAAKKMALLMARLSELVQKDSKGSKRELIATAKAIAEASEEVSRLARGLARECTDKRIRTNLLQVCERIPTIGTQLRILSTVKATMLGAQGSEEDREATEMLVGNAQNLMQSVKETVRAAEGASIKIRSDQAGTRLRWIRRQPWYQY